MPSDEIEQRRQYLSLAPSASSKGITLVFEPTVDVTYGSRRRSKEILRRMVRLFRNADLEPHFENDVVCVTVWQPPKGLRGLLAAIDAEVDAFRSERLHPREVEEALTITARERRRWTKDGRLPTSGHTSFRRGQNSVYLLLYPADAIADLAQRREQIEAWRRADEVGRIEHLAGDPETESGDATLSTA